MKQLMRERQQMASRPFASVAMVLEVGGDQEELQQCDAVGALVKLAAHCLKNRPSSSHHFLLSFSLFPPVVTSDC
ncbi:attractin-like protein 1 [Poecilia latipinna]|uniref:attractin-like protein 1 n=1 Tax=Poecilia latipinna TaxID=48699 RepID=UPI00072E9C32|nr:PREDICTED: attractin-like protein 1 [Poecilia latipinna]